MSKKPPNRPGIIFEVGARVEAQDYLQKWYPSRIEEIDYDEGKMLVHFDRWSHRYDEWIFWDSNRLRPLERPALRKEGLKEEDDMSERLSEMRTSRLGELPGSTESTEDQTELPQPRQELRDGEEVLARWTDCRYYPAKIEAVNKEGTYTVQFYDGVIRCVKRIHIKSMPEDAKGQDWIALVKAATTAAKSKGAPRSRTSANSNKDREEHRELRSDEEEQDELEDDDEGDSERQDVESAGEEECRSLSEQQDMGKAKRRRTRQTVLCHSKRVRTNKARGCHEETDCKEEQRDVQVDEECEEAPVEEKALKPVAPLSATSPARPRNRRLKHDSGESSNSSLKQAGDESESSRSPASAHSLADAAQPAAVPPCSPQRKRRSQRLANSFEPTCPPSPHNKAPSPSPLPVNTNPSEHEGKGNNDSQEAEGRLNLPKPAASGSPAVVAPPVSSCPFPLTEQEKQADDQTPVHTSVEEKARLVTAAGSKAATRTLKANRHTREPIINNRKSEDTTSPNDCIDLDHNKFKCKVPGCSKAFRKAKLLDYHLKYYHNTDKEPEAEMGSPDRVGRTRATSASMPTCTLVEVPESKRRRTVSTSSSLSPQSHILQLDGSSSLLRPPKFCKKKRSSASVSSDSTEVSLPPPPRDKAFEGLPDKILKKVVDKEPGLCVKNEKKCQITGKRKEKDKVRKERKEKDPFKLKQKKKKKKKKKSKQHCYSELEDMSMAFMERTSPPPLHCSSSTSAFALLNSSSSSSSKHAAFQYPRAILTVDLTGENLSDVDFLEDSTTESLLLSGDEYNQDLESFAMDEFHYDDEDAANEIVRCICEMDEENGFMIQCEECMCWQHSVCMGLLEDSIPDQYICYICRDPPGQRCNARYWHDKDWLNKGHMYGLSFLTENYSHQNAKKIVSTHQLLGDVYSVKKVLHGLQLKMDILQANHNPSLHLWARSWVNSDEEQPMGGVPDCVHFRDRLCQNTDTYITSEHSYQKPAETLGHTHHRLAEPGVRLDTLTTQRKEDEDDSTICLAGCVNDGSVDQARNCLQWQMNLLTHIEDLQNQVAGRMDLIEKELDVLESWLDFTGELEPPDPLGRLPQLKCRINQLLTDLGKVQQMSTLCSV
ncbi:PHD finger protein 20-like protein 1 isoform X2 [Denticeps clupeoides]|uniref:PHD finger protein 20-like protein 1 isoform X2 n=1 Tax=Denticeps clupeoides TaxID=299321 RepID=UPI0010A33B7A|nr:PHD finger protein 20-like protein 1 isoform X2 [Denticeps clupeoides]